MQAIFPVAGLGSRMFPATKSVPKELLTILNKPIIHYVVEEALDAGIEEIILVTSREKQPILEYFKKPKKNVSNNSINFFHKKLKISTVFQEKPLGLGHAILCAKHLIKNDFFGIFLPDEVLLENNKIIDFKNMMKYLKKNCEGQILVEKVSKKEVSNYGIVQLESPQFKSNGLMRIKKILEKPSFTKSTNNYRVVGRYILPKDIFSFLEKTKTSSNNEIELTDAINKMIGDRKLNINACLNNSEIYDCGSVKGFVGANIAFSLLNNELRKYVKALIND